MLEYYQAKLNKYFWSYFKAASIHYTLSVLEPSKILKHTREDDINLLSDMIPVGFFGLFLLYFLSGSKCGIM